MSGKTNFDTVTLYGPPQMRTRQIKNLSSIQVVVAQLGTSTDTLKGYAQMVTILGIEAGALHQVQSAPDHVSGCEGGAIGLPCVQFLAFTYQRTIK
jgi:hypothetical protein